MRVWIIFVLFTSLFFTSTPLYAEYLINCTNGGSATVGDLKHQVRVSCGEPQTTEIIGYIDKVQNEERIRVMKIEEWIYSASMYGEKSFFSLVFEGNKLITIKKVKY